MKFLMYLILFMIAFGCTGNHDIEITEIIQDENLDTNLTTRAQEDSIAVAISSSILLKEIDAYNDSVMALPQPYSLRSWLKRVGKIALADVAGFAGGALLGFKLIPAMPIPLYIGALSAVGTSGAAAANLESPQQLRQKIPASANMRFETLDKCANEVMSNDNYDTKYIAMQSKVGNIEMFNDYTQYFDAAILHNLILDNFMAEDCNNLATNQSLFTPSQLNIIYDDKVMNILQNDFQEIPAGNINWGYLFSDRINMMTTISQAKAAGVMRRFESLMALGQAIEYVKIHTYNFMILVQQSEEISSEDKQVLLQTLPIYMYSAVYWKETLNIEDKEE